MSEVINGGATIPYTLEKRILLVLFFFFAVSLDSPGFFLVAIVQDCWISEKLLKVVRNLPETATL